MFMGSKLLNFVSKSPQQRGASDSNYETKGTILGRQTAVHQPMLSVDGIPNKHPGILPTTIEKQDCQEAEVVPVLKVCKKKASWALLRLEALGLCFLCFEALYTPPAASQSPSSGGPEDLCTSPAPQRQTAENQLSRSLDPRSM